MIRSVFATLAALVVVTAGGAQGCAASGVGDPCIPEGEYDPGFIGFNAGEVNVESKSFQCLTRLCLVNHFQGRVTCPYGQSKDQTSLPGCDTGFGDSTACLAFSAISADQSSPPNPVGACVVPGTSIPVAGDSVADPQDLAHVRPQCVDRIAANTVYCSCRCANAAGKTDDGANYCSCPDGFTCSQLISPVGTGIDPDLVGAYCIKKNTAYDPNSSCGSECDPTLSQDSCPASPIL